LTVAASGAALCVFVGAARTALRESVTDAEQPSIVASKASINSYLERAGKRSAMRTSIISLGPQTIALRAPHSRATRRSIHRMVGDREDSTTDRSLRLNASSRSDR
jgi:hypothetical protein